MSALGDHFPAFQKGAGGAVSPADQDEYKQFVFANIATGALGTRTNAAAGAFVFDNVLLDYPRNIHLIMLGEAAGMGGSAIVYGVDRWGNAINETFTIGSANGGGTVAGTRIFTKITSGSITSIDGGGGTAIGTCTIGYAVGTSATAKMWLGLPTKIGGTADVKMLTYIKNFVVTPLGGGTLSTANINATYHAVGGTETAGTAHTYSVLYKSTYDNIGKANLAQL